METQNDILRNPDSFLQIGDLVAGSFFLASSGLIIIAIFLLFQRRKIPDAWRIPFFLASFVPLIAGVNSYYRKNYWITTQTSPVEFRFFDWFLTVPLMCIVFYYLLRRQGAKLSMLVCLFLGSIWMISFGYIGEAVFPEESIKWGILGSIGFAIIIGSIIGFGYPKIFKHDTDPVLKKGYLCLSILLPIGWSVYPLGYMTVPGNIMEGSLSVNTVTILYNIGDLFNKGFLALCVYYMATHSVDALRNDLSKELQKMGKSEFDGQNSTENGNDQLSSNYSKLPI